MSNRNDYNTLKHLVEEHGLRTVVDMLAAIADDKAKNILQDKVLDRQTAIKQALTWRNDANTLMATCINDIR